MGLTLLSKEMFEAFARRVRRVSCSTICLGGGWRKFAKSAARWESFCAWRPKRYYFSSSKMGLRAKAVADPHASSKPPAQETDTRGQAAPTREPADCAPSSD